MITALMNRSASPIEVVGVPSNVNGRAAGKVKADTMGRGDSPPGLSQEDVCLLIDRVAELERALADAKRYLEACRQAIGAREGELLIDAIQRRSSESAQRSSR